MALDQSNAPPTPTGAPSGIPDPSNPGYDTAGFPLSGPSAPPPTQTSFVNTSAQPFTGPSGIPDPKNPGYDTAGFRLGATYDKTTGQLTIPNSATGKTATSTIDPRTGAILSPQTAGAPSGISWSTPSGAPGPNPLAPFNGTPPNPTIALPPKTWSDFVGPQASDILNDPGYQFMLGQGISALQNSASAKGVLNDPETAQAIESYGQGLASTQWNNIYNRDLNTWQQTNYTPGLAQWNAQIGQNNTNYDHSWNEFLQLYKQYFDRYSSTLGVATAP